MIIRLQENYATQRLFKSKALIIYGPRQAGKTTFVEQLLATQNQPTLRLNGDEADTREILEKPNKAKLIYILGNNQIIFIDEAQRISEIGLVIKIIVDQIKTVQVIATGSSSFELAGQINEPLTGRKYEMLLLPFAHAELLNHTDFLTQKRNLEQRLIFGSYPEIVVNPQMAQEHLQLIADSYLYKDLFALENLKKPIALEKLVKALALQIGSEVNINELSKTVGIDNKTIEKYLVMLEQAFVIFSLPSFSKNVSNELKKSRKIYFYDNGIINAVTRNFNPIRQRNDVGFLWENYLVSERKKRNNLKNQSVDMFFWRTTQQQEVDYIETTANSLLAFEFKWTSNSRKKFPKTFTKAYPNAVCKEVNQDNYFEFLGE